MMKFKYLVLLVLFVFFKNSFSQVTIYSSYDDFQNNKGQEYGETESWIYGDKSFKLTKNGVKKKVKHEDIWGFLYKNNLFRVTLDNGSNHIVYVRLVGKLVFYENGGAYLTMLYKEIEPSEVVYFYTGYKAYISKSLGSPIIPIVKGHNGVDIRRFKKKTKKFQEDHPEYSEFFKCLKNYRIETVKRCVAKFEGVKDLN